MTNSLRTKARTLYEFQADLDCLASAVKEEKVKRCSPSLNWKMNNEYIGRNQGIAHSLEFESAIVKILERKGRGLNDSERDAVEHLRTNSSVQPHQAAKQGESFMVMRPAKK